MPAARAYFVGEVHKLWEGQPFKFEMICWAGKERGIHDVVMEMGKSEAYMFNAYFTTGDTTIFRYYGHTPDVEEQLSRWQEAYSKCPFTLHGMDFERLIFVPVVMSIMEKTEKATKTELYTYLSKIEADAKDVDDDITGKKQSIRMYEKAQKLFVREKDQLKAMLSTGYGEIEAIMENPTTQKHFSRRDKGMARNLQQLTDQGLNFLCIAGIGHTTLHHKTMVRRYTEAGNTAVIINMMCRNCYTSSYFGSGQYDIIADYEGKNDKYMIANFGKYYDPECYSLIEQTQLKDLPGGYNSIPTYYVLFKDQPAW